MKTKHKISFLNPKSTKKKNRRIRIKSSHMLQPYKSVSDIYIFLNKFAINNIDLLDCLVVLQKILLLRIELTLK